MIDDHHTARTLIGLVLQDLASETEILLLIAQALEDRANGIARQAEPQKLRELAALVKSTALQLGMAAANVVGTAERLRIVAEFADVADAGGGDLPS